jgi:hypothetical protein
MTITLDRLRQFIDEIREQYQREEEQAILQRDMEKAVRALAGKDACSRLANSIGLGAEMDRNMVRVIGAKRRD